MVSLAEAPVDEVLAAWQGLGYYGRARNLHRAARRVVRELGGRIPDDVETLESLPGIGPYTARAIASIAFHKNAAVVDGNVARVLCRLFALPWDPSSPADRNRLQQLADRLLPDGQASSFNQALMDLGALLCIPRSPRCALCPVARYCRSFRKDKTALYPLRRTRLPLPIRHRLMAAILHRGSLLLQKRGSKGLLAGLWELPARTVETDENESRAWKTLKGALSQIVEISPAPGIPPVRIEHGYTHFLERVSVVVCTARPLRRPSNRRTGERRLRWIHPKVLTRYALTGVTVKALRALAAHGVLPYQKVSLSGPNHPEPPCHVRNRKQKHSTPRNWKGKA